MTDAFDNVFYVILFQSSRVFSPII